MSKIAVLVTDGFEDDEYTKPVEAMKKPGHQVVTIDLKAGKTIKGKSKGTQVKIDKGIDEVSVKDFDALLIPGGYSPDKLRVDPRPVKFVKEFVQSGKPVCAICHGPQLMISADVLRGKKATAWKSLVQDIKNAGAQYLDQEVVEDGNLVFSRGPADIPAFNKACLAKLK